MCRISPTAPSSYNAAKYVSATRRHVFPRHSPKIDIARSRRRNRLNRVYSFAASCPLQPYSPIHQLFGIRAKQQQSPHKGVRVAGVGIMCRVTKVSATARRTAALPDEPRRHRDSSGVWGGLGPRQYHRAYLVARACSADRLPEIGSCIGNTRMHIPW